MDARFNMSITPASSLGERARSTSTHPPAMIAIGAARATDEPMAAPSFFDMSTEPFEEDPPGDTYNDGVLESEHRALADPSVLNADSPQADPTHQMSATNHTFSESVVMHTAPEELSPPGWIAVLRELKRLPWQSWLPVGIGAVLMIFMAGIFAGEFMAERRALAELNTTATQLEQQISANHQAAQLKFDALTLHITQLEQAVSERDARLTAAERQTVKLTQALLMEHKVKASMLRQLHDLEERLAQVATSLARLTSAPMSSDSTSRVDISTSQ